MIPDEEEISKISPEIMDKNIETIFLTLLKLHFILIKDTGVFPLDPGKLLKEFMKPLSLEIGIPFDFKLSSYKKINNFSKFVIILSCMKIKSKYQNCEVVSFENSKLKDKLNYYIFM